MGKVLIAKLLITCPDIGDIFLLFRKKKNIDPQTRLQLILQVHYNTSCFVFSNERKYVFNEKNAYIFFLKYFYFFIDILLI